MIDSECNFRENTIRHIAARFVHASRLCHGPHQESRTYLIHYLFVTIPHFEKWRMSPCAGLHACFPVGAPQGVHSLVHSYGRHKEYEPPSSPSVTLSNLSRYLVRLGFEPVLLPFCCLSGVQRSFGQVDRGLSPCSVTGYLINGIACLRYLL